MAGFVVNADDFGRSQEINRAVIRAHHEGILTSASLLVGGDAADEAVELARQTPTLAVGLHVVVSDGRAVLPPSRIPGLVNAHGWFADQPARLGLKYAFNRTLRHEMALEVEAQFERFARTGLRLDHVDGHQHMHMHPAVFGRVAELARRFGALRIRIVADDLALALRHHPSHMVAKASSAMVFRALAHHCRRVARHSGLYFAKRSYGFFQSGAMDENYVLAVLRRASDGDEIYFHPTEGPRLDELGPNRGDLQTLLSPAVARLAASRREADLAQDTAGRRRSGGVQATA